MRRLTYFVATSLDGYIASPTGGFDAFAMQGDHIAALLRDYPETLPAPALAAANITSENRTFDTVVMGWNTYAVGLPALPSPYPHLRQFVCSRHHTSPGDAVTVTGEDPRQLVARLKAEASTRDIWLCGGGRLAATLAADIDRLVLKLNPVVLGAGIRVFESASYAPQPFHLVHSHAYASGVVMHHYDRVLSA